MAPPHVTLLAFFLLTATSTLVNAYAPMTLTLVNNCPFSIWPAIQPSAGSVVLEKGGFALPAFSHRSFPAPDAPWSGRVWARTGCVSYNGRFTCDTGSCGNRVDCQGAGGATPTSLAQISVHQGGPADHVAYSVSFVDGFNLPVTVTPHDGRGTCPVVGCTAKLLDTCPQDLLYKATMKGRVVGCQSGCQARGTDELCCRGAFSSQQSCRPSSYSNFFKYACPSALTYAHDTSSLPQDCAAPGELKIIFCQ